MITPTQIKTATEVFGTGMNIINFHKLDPTHKRILAITELYPKAVNDKSLLLAKFYEPLWNYNDDLYSNLKRQTRPETILRRFRDLREWGYITYSKESDADNFQAFKNERERHSPSYKQISFINRGITE